MVVDDPKNLFSLDLCLCFYGLGNKQATLTNDAINPFGLPFRTILKFHLKQKNEMVYKITTTN